MYIPTHYTDTLRESTPREIKAFVWIGWRPDNSCGVKYGASPFPIDVNGRSCLFFFSSLCPSGKWEFWLASNVVDTNGKQTPYSKDVSQHTFVPLFIFLSTRAQWMWMRDEDLNLLSLFIYFLFLIQSRDTHTYVCTWRQTKYVNAWAYERWHTCWNQERKTPDYIF